MVDTDEDEAEAVPKVHKFLGSRTNPKASLSDLYETSAEAIEELIRTKFADVLNPSQMVIYDPACGHNAILNVFEKQGFQVVGDDLHTHPDKKDFPPIPFYHRLTSS